MEQHAINTSAHASLRPPATVGQASDDALREVPAGALPTLSPPELALGDEEAPFLMHIVSCAQDTQGQEEESERYISRRTVGAHELDETVGNALTRALSLCPIPTQLPVPLS